MFTLLLVIFILDVLLMIPIILLQSGSGAQSGVFGSDLAMGAFGAKTSEVLVSTTKWLVGIFFISAFVMGYIKVQESKAFTRQVQTEQNTQTPEMTTSQTNSASNNLNTINTNGMNTIPIK